MPAASIRARRSSAGGAALRGDAGGRAADRNGAGALRIPGREVQGDRAADGDARQRDLAGDAEMIEQGRDVVGHRIEGKLAAHLLRQSGAAGVIAQHAARSREPWRDVVPAFERAAHFVNQHQRAVAAAAQLAAQADAVGFNEIHPAPPVFLLIFLFVTASDWPVSLEIRGPRYRRRYESQIPGSREQEAMSVVGEPLAAQCIRAAIGRAQRHEPAVR